VIIAVPFASIRRRGGLAVNIAAAMVLAFVYIAFTEITKAVGATLDIPAVIIGWSANVLFGLIALFTIMVTRR
jgi:lipopolysaccharide export system permease protein